MKKLLISILTITMLVCLTACGNSTETENGGTSSGNMIEDNAVKPQETPEDNAVKPQESQEEKAAFEPVPIGDFTAQDFEGNSVTKDIFADYDLTLVNLWTTTCSYCIQEMPALNELRDEMQKEGKKFNIIAIGMDVGNTEKIYDTFFETAKEIIKKTGVTYPNLIPDSVLLEGRLKGIQAYPESFFVDKEGNIVSEPYVGAMPKNHWRVTINNEFEKLSPKADKE